MKKEQIAGHIRHPHDATVLAFDQMKSSLFVMGLHYRRKDERTDGRTDERTDKRTKDGTDKRTQN